MSGKGSNLNGAGAVVQTLVEAGVDHCFANPGTSEMHLVAALDQVGGMRPILGLFEGVTTGAADGFARMTGRPAATLLHLGPGLANGLANLHNARRARSGVINLIGDHATYHREFDAPLTSDIETLARPMSAWVRTSKDVAAVTADCCEAIEVASAPSCGVATLIIPADVAWSAGALPEKLSKLAAATVPPKEAIDTVAKRLREDGSDAALVLAGAALRGRGLEAAGRIAAATGCRLMSPTFNARAERGAGRVFVQKIPYLGEMATEALKGLKHLILVGASPPVSFFAYEGKDSWLTPDSCAIDMLSKPDEDGVAALQALADELGAPAEPAGIVSAEVPPLASGNLTPEAVAAALANFMPEGAIVSDEAITSGFPLLPMTRGAAPHEWLDVMGGALGQGMPVAVGAAVACPDRKVISLEGDGAAMYTIQSLWTQARENLDILTIVYANRTYAILNLEHMRTGAGEPGEQAARTLTLDTPALDFVSIAKGMGVEAARADTAEKLNDLVKTAMTKKGPFLIEAEVNVLSLV